MTVSCSVRDDILKLRETMDEQLKVPNPADPPRYQVVEVDQRVMKADLATLEEEIRWGKYCWFHMTPESLRQYKRKGSELGDLCVSTMQKAFDQIHDNTVSLMIVGLMIVGLRNRTVCMNGG